MRAGEERRRFRVALAMSAALLAVTGARAEDNDGGPWRDMAESDLAFIRKTLDEKNIYAAYLPRAEWTQLLDRADAQAVEDLSKVSDPASYAGALERYAGVLQDPHASVRLKFAPSNYRWPRLAAAYRGGQYRIVLSETPKARAGDVVTSCGGEPIAAIVEKIIKANGDVEGPEASKAAAARALFVDDGSPFRPKLETCHIGGEDVTLDWSRISSQALAVKLEDFAQFRDVDVHAGSFARNAVWVRMGVFGPGPEQAAQYHQLIKAAPSWRNKQAIVFDVRGNGGGSYNWFMAVLRALYGDAYADYYARARTEITAVFAENIAYKTKSEREKEKVEDPLNTPPDKLLDDAYAGGFEEMTSPGGATVYALKPDLPPLAEKVPASLVKADVYVLTDYGCGSACVSFVDEMRRFPGVTHIGLETYFDRLSGSPVAFDLPSGSGLIYVPSMLRLGRARGDNEQVTPQIKYDGDIADTAAVKAWTAKLIDKK